MSTETINFDEKNITDLRNLVMEKLNWVRGGPSNLNKNQLIFMLKHKDIYKRTERICNACGIKKPIAKISKINGKYQRRCMTCRGKNINTNKDFDKLEVEEEQNINVPEFEENESDSEPNSENVIQIHNDNHADMANIAIMEVNKIISINRSIGLNMNDQNYLKDLAEKLFRSIMTKAESLNTCVINVNKNLGNFLIMSLIQEEIFNSKKVMLSPDDIIIELNGQYKKVSICKIELNESEKQLLEVKLLKKYKVPFVPEIKPIIKKDNIKILTEEEIQKKLEILEDPAMKELEEYIKNISTAPEEPYVRSASLERLLTVDFNEITEDDDKKDELNYIDDLDD